MIQKEITLNGFMKLNHLKKMDLLEKYGIIEKNDNALNVFFDVEGINNNGYVVTKLIINKIIEDFVTYINDNKEQILDPIKRRLELANYSKEKIEELYTEHNTVLEQYIINSPYPFVSKKGLIDVDKLKETIFNNYFLIHLMLFSRAIFETEQEHAFPFMFEEYYNVIVLRLNISYLGDMQGNIISKKTQLSARKAVLLIEQIYELKHWEQVPGTKKAKLISMLIGVREDTIREFIYDLRKKPEELSKQYHRDKEYINKILKELEIL